MISCGIRSDMVTHVEEREWTHLDLGKSDYAPEIIEDGNCRRRSRMKSGQAFAV